jgi:hypothetical protein
LISEDIYPSSEFSDTHKRVNERPTQEDEYYDRSEDIWLEIWRGFSVHKAILKCSMEVKKGRRRVEFSF